MKKSLKKINLLKLHFFSGYDCDSLALENVTGFAKHILGLFRKYPDIDLEFRTKSLQKAPFISSKFMENIILAYSLMPEAMSSALDNKTPTIAKRIDIMTALAAKGWKIGLRFDPLIHGKNWKKLYQELFETVFVSVPLKSIHSVSFGSLRFPKQMFKNITKLYPEENYFQDLYLIIMELFLMIMILKRR